MKKLIALTLALLMVLSVTACASSSAPADDGGIQKVAFLAPITSSEYWMTITENTKAACEGAGLECTIYSCESDAAVQLQQIENCITSEVDAIIIDPVDAGSSEDALIKAREAGVFVVMTSSISENTETYDVGISVSETMVGDMAAQAAAAWIDATFPDAGAESVGVAIYALPFRPIDIERTEAFKNVFNYTDKARLDVEYELSVERFATEVTEYAAVMLQNYPDVKCIISYTDAFSNSIDEVLKGSSGVDLSKIANICVDVSTATYTNITAAKNGESTVVAAVVPGMTMHEQILEALQGTITFDDEAAKLAYKDITVVTTENVSDYFAG